MTSLATLLDHLDNVTGSLERPGRRASPAAGHAWPALARAAAGSLLRVPTLDPPDAAPLYRALFGLADWPRSARTGGRQPLHQLTRTYQQIGGLLAGLPGARGRDQLHAEALRERLLRPLHAAAVWTLRSPDVLDSGQEALLDALARHTPDAAGPVTGTRYGDLGAVTRSALDPVDRVLASWREGVTGSLHPAVVSTAGLRATLADLTIATATAYYLVKTVGAAGLLDRSIAVPAGTALWEARQEWRAQARAFPDDLRLGGPVPEDRTRLADTLRDGLAGAFHDSAGDWLPPTVLLEQHPPDQLLGWARHLAGTAATIADRYADALGVLRTRPVRRRDPGYQPVWPVGTDLAKVPRTRWLSVPLDDPGLRLLAQRGRFAAGLAGHALTLVQDTALGRARTPAEQAAYATEAGLRTLTGLLDAALPPSRHRHGHLDPELRPAWRDGRVPPESLPDPAPAPTGSDQDWLARGVHLHHRRLPAPNPGRGIAR